MTGRRYILGRPALSGEEWRPIPGFPDFKISSIGRLRDMTGLIRPHRHERRAFNTIRNGDVVLHAPRARFVLMTFVGPAPEGRPLARHLNDDPTDDRLENLAWGSKKDNQLDAMRNGRANYQGLLRNGAPPANKGRTLTLEQRAICGSAARGRIVITNGIEERRVLSDSSIPKGWHRGRSLSFVMSRWGVRNVSSHC